MSRQTPHNRGRAPGRDPGRDKKNSQPAAGVKGGSEVNGRAKNGGPPGGGPFYTHLFNYINYATVSSMYRFASILENMGPPDTYARQLAELHPAFIAGLEWLKSESPDFDLDSDEAAVEPCLDFPGEGIPPTDALIERYRPEYDRIRAEFRRGAPNLTFETYIQYWRKDFKRYLQGDLKPILQLGDEDLATEDADEALEGAGEGAEAKKPRHGPRHPMREAFPVHSSAPVYDIGETIARGRFTLPQGGKFPSASIIGGTQGRIELLPFWDHANNRPLTPQSVNLAASAPGSEFSHMQEEAVRIATSYNEEMATYFYAMDAYWLTHARSAEDYVELEIADLLQYTGKKPVKSHGRYTGTYRPDQLQRAGMMVYGMGFSMVELERAVIKGVGERTHFKRLWDVTDMYMMTTLDDESYIESMTYRPNEFFRNASFGSRRETALLMSKVLSLDYDKMVTARRLGRYYTWLWRDRAYAGNIAAPISCARLLERAGIEVEKGKERFARRSLETALDRLESEGIIAQWVLLEMSGLPADMEARISFPRWLEMKISVSPPDVILDHYAAIAASPAQQAAITGGSGGRQQSKLDVAAIQAARKARGFTLAMLSEETGVELSTLSRILTGKTKRPHSQHVKALNDWAAKVTKPGEEG